MADRLIHQTAAAAHLPAARQGDDASGMSPGRPRQKPSAIDGNDHTGLQPLTANKTIDSLSFADSLIFRLKSGKADVEWEV